MKFRYYWEDFTQGRVFEHGSRTLSEDEIIAFAREWDPQRFHIDPEAAKQTPYSGIIASAWHTGSAKRHSSMPGEPTHEDSLR